MLDPEAPDERREEIANGARQRIESGGELKHAESWGMRKMAFEIRQRTEADYRFYRFHTDGPLLNDLDHTLKITDGVMRFRIFKVDPGAPVSSPPATTQPAGVSARAERGERRTAEAATLAAERAESEAEEAPAAEAEDAPAESAPEPEEAPAEPEPGAEPEPEPAAEPEPAPEGAEPTEEQPSE
jgi:small subunit ribosomal protein S6